MNDIIYQQIQSAVQSGKMIQAIKLLRQVENLNLVEAKEKIQDMADRMRDEQYDSPALRAREQNERSAIQTHTHQPARQQLYNIEQELPTEAFLFFQKGEVEKGIDVIQAVKGINKSSAKRMAKMFFNHHPEYSSKEIIRLMGSNISVSETTQRPGTSSNKSTTRSNSSNNKKKKKTGIFESIIFFIIFINIIRACAS